MGFYDFLESLLCFLISKSFKWLVVVVFSFFFASSAFATFNGTFWVKNIGSGDHLRVSEIEAFSNIETVSTTYSGNWTHAKNI